MNRFPFVATAVVLCLSPCVVSAQQKLPPIPAIERSLPPVGNPIPAEEKAALEAKLKTVSDRLPEIAEHPLAADVTVYTKAVRFALEDGEWYGKKDTEKARAALAEAAQRVTALVKGEAPWTKASGLVVRGFSSKIDHSPQPYGLEIPATLDRANKVPLYVWLHGRGDKATDLHFINERTHRAGPFAMTDGIVLHPFGRQCVGYKSAGEIDVQEAIDDVISQYNIDENRIVLMGFSMGGAGAWHLGAHYTDRFCAVHAGAGFAETARYNRLKSEDYPPKYEQELWGWYDVPNYALNFLNVPLIAYSGEMDKQKQAADIMAAALKAEGHTLQHIIGPGMGHKYHPDSLKKIGAFIQTAVANGRNPYPDTVTLQTRTLRYNRMHWVTMNGMKEQWRDARIDATADKEAGSVTAKTRNVSHFNIELPWPVKRLTVDGMKVEVPEVNSGSVWVQFKQDQWLYDILQAYRPKKSGLQGPIDDAFLGEFLVVKPSKQSGNALLDRWVDFEIAHMETRWRQVFRGDLPIVFDHEITPADMNKNLILWGTAETNSVWSKQAIADDFKQTVAQISIGQTPPNPETQIVAMIRLNPLNTSRYIVFNSGPTFREGHDRTNSLQNPKLPDWALIDLTRAPNATSPGRIAAAGFFDDDWQFTKDRTWENDQ
ncbi:MAG: prolyl oligopeptidase family serine peptidase [Verrucomicrobiae bacterium]|nr:prolyl oligopeptidase family serine peptidase [Verrucomicrobiae bacterium]